jgi:hypothetical protein
MNAARFFRRCARHLLTQSMLVSMLIAGNEPAGAAEALTPVTKNKLQTLSPIQHAALSADPATNGPLRILLVDDDASENNNDPRDRRKSLSDTVFGKLVGEAVGGDQQSWATEIVKTYASGPAIDRLRPYSLIVWYTGASYGGNPDNTAVLSLQDEKTVRRYLEETGGTVLLISPGYVSKVLDQSSSWDQTSWPFLTEVIGIQGGRGLAQRFQPGTVTSTQGARFQIGKGGVVESQFSAVNPKNAQTIFTTEIATMKGTVPVATTSKYGKGDFIYVGFTFENLDAKELAPAFQQLLSADVAKPVTATNTACSAPTVPTGNASNAGPATVQVSGTPTTAVVSWSLPTATIRNASLTGTATAVRAVPTKQTATQAPSAAVERLVPNAASVPLSLSSPDAVTAKDPGPLTPGQAVTYRVTLKNGCDMLGAKEASFTPPLPQDPSGLAATVAANRSVTLTWQATQDSAVTGYRITSTSLTEPVTVRYASQWTSPPQAPGSQQWKVASLYEPGGVLTAPSAWPSVMSRVIPTPGKPFLVLPNGPGSHSESVAHYRTQCFSLSADISNCRAAQFIAPETHWQAAWLSTAGSMHSQAREWPRVQLHNTLDLDAWRIANCAPRRNGRTVCWTTTHHNKRAFDDENTFYRPGAAETPTSLAIIILLDDNRSFFGSWETNGSPLSVEAADLVVRDHFRGAFDMEHSYANVAQPTTGAQLDTQGRKGVPHACLSCHGGRFDASTGLVIGTSLLPIVPARLDGSVDDEFWVSRFNEIVLTTNPAPAIVAQLSSIYGGTPIRAGARANDAAVPAGWSQQPGLYRQIILPYCSSCHFAQRGPFNFQSWSNLLQNKAAVQRSVCSEFTMPHSEILFRKFWSEGGAVSLPGMLSTALGYPKCPQ